MIELFMMLVRTLLPFLKESVLQGLTPKEWFSRNKIGCLWLSVVLVLVFSVMHLSSLVFRQSMMVHEMTTNLNRQTFTVQTLTMERDQARKDLTELQRGHSDLSAQHEALLEEAAALEERKELYETWLRNCGVDHTYEGNGFPSCPVKRVVVRRTVQAPAQTVVLPPVPVEERKTSFRERLGKIFGGKKDKDESE